MFETLSFVHPWLLALLFSLPILWWLLRLTPPSPLRLAFPAIQLLFGLDPKEETPHHSPWWLLLLRLMLAAFIIVAFAHPLWDEEQSFSRSGSVLLVMDNDWASAQQWDRHRKLALEILDEAERTGRDAALLLTAQPQPEIIFEQARTITTLLNETSLQAWLSDRGATLRKLREQNLPSDLNIFWISNGLHLSQADDGLASYLAGLGNVTIYRSDLGQLPRFIMSGGNNNNLSLTFVRPAGGPEEQLMVGAYDLQNHRLGSQQIRMATGESMKFQKLNWPLELLNRIKRIAIDGQNHAGASFLSDGSGGVKPIGYITSNPETSRQALLGPLYYLERALGNETVRTGPLPLLLAQPISVLVLPDNTILTDEERGRLMNWIENGGMLIRFAGTNLANNVETDDLVPVKLRNGVRELGGTLSWTKNQDLAPFPDYSPFAGLPLPKDIHIQAQLLAEPDIELDRKTWAKLSDGTPLVTGTPKAKGFLVLFHTSGNASWSDLVLSGLFVQMLNRLTDLSLGIDVQGKKPDQVLPPAFLMDGLGNLTLAGPEERALSVKDISEGPAGPERLPGLYGKDEQYSALNVTTGMKEVPTILDLPNMRKIEEVRTLDLKPWLLLLAFLTMLFDFILSLFLRGFVGRIRESAKIAGVLAIFFFPIFTHAAQEDEDIIQAISVTHLAYVETGNRQVDQISRAGLIGLTGILLTRTSTDIGDPVAVNLESDELSFYPILYWPISSTQPPLSSGAIAKVNAYLAHGGLIFFDTGDRPLNNLTQGEGGPGTIRLQELTADLKIPLLIPIPADHVLGRSFYLLREYPGRWMGGDLWVEQRGARLNDGVASIIIGSNDYASAWAIDEYGRPLYPVTPGGERQRELAYRFGVNLVMYALTGNYKTDQVHIPAILQRLGQ